MITREFFARSLAGLMVALLVVPTGLMAQQAQQSGQAEVFKQEELEQILAPIALHPDDLIAQILMASLIRSKCPGDRWAKQNASLKGERLTKSLEAQDGTKRKVLVTFPQVLTMMSEKLIGRRSWAMLF